MTLPARLLLGLQVRFYFGWLF